MSLPLLLIALTLLALLPGSAAAQHTQPAAPREFAAATVPAQPAAAPVASAVNSESAPVPEYRLTDAASDRSVVWDGARALAAFGIVLVLLAAGVKALRRWPGLAGRVTATGPLQVLGRLPLTAKESVCLVRAGAEVLVLGVSGAGVTLLHRLENGLAEAEQIGAVAARPALGRPGAMRFRELAARIREVQVAWGFNAADRKGSS